MTCRGIKGATTSEENSEAAILDATRELLTELLGANGVGPSEIAAVFFTCTKDLNAAFPAKVAREMGLTAVPLLCAQEIDVPATLGKCIRVVVLVDTAREQGQLKHRYLRGARALRPDLMGESTAHGNAVAEGAVPRTRGTPVDPPPADRSGSVDQNQKGKPR